MATAGAVLTIQGSGYQAGEPVSFWINIPEGTTISSDSLGEPNTIIDGSVIPLNSMANADQLWRVYLCPEHAAFQPEIIPWSVMD